MNECVQFSRMWDKLTSKVSQAHLSLAEKKKEKYFPLLSIINLLHPNISMHILHTVL